MAKKRGIDLDAITIGGIGANLSSCWVSIDCGHLGTSRKVHLDELLGGAVGQSRYVVQSGPFSGTAPSGVTAGYDRTAKKNYIVNDSTGQWEVDPDGQDEQEITDGDLASAGNPVTSDVDTFAAANDIRNTVVNYPGSGSMQVPDYSWYVDESHNATLIRSPGGTTITQTYQSVATKGDRPSVTLIGYLAHVQSNGLNYIWNGSGWTLLRTFVPLTEAQIDALDEAELEEDMVILNTDDLIWIHWSSADGFREIGAPV